MIGPTQPPTPPFSPSPHTQNCYYVIKFGLRPVPEDAPQKREVVRRYVQGLQWVLEYYFRGCPSWGWFYPYHYAPTCSDLLDLSGLDISYELGTPFLPFQQLMACLPPFSAGLLPEPHRWLMTAPDSPLADFYPPEFAVDMNGKRNPWEGVALLPFVGAWGLGEGGLAPPLTCTHTHARTPTLVQTRRRRARSAGGHGHTLPRHAVDGIGAA